MSKVKPSIMIVDDDDDVHMILNAILESRNCTVTNATSVTQALHCLEEKPVDLIIIDITMKPLDGFFLLDAIKKSDQWRHIPALMLTSENDRETIYRCINLGAKDYILKPINAFSFRNKIKKYLDAFNKTKYIFREKEIASLSVDIKLKSISKNCIKFDSLNSFSEGEFLKINIIPKASIHPYSIPCVVHDPPKKPFFKPFYSYELTPLLAEDTFTILRNELSQYE